MGSVSARPTTVEKEGMKRKRFKKGAAAKPRGPDVPQCPPSSYLLFQNYVRQAMKKANSAMANHEILTKISQRWAGTIRVPENADFVLAET